MPRILVIGPAWVGDMVLAQPMLKHLAAQAADMEVDVLAPAWSRPVLQRMPSVHRIWDMPLGHGRLGLRERWQLGVQLRSQNYIQAVVLPNSWKSALIPWVAGIALRTGWRGEWRYGLLNDLRVLEPQRYPRMVDRFLALAVPKGAPVSAHSIPHLEINADCAQQVLQFFELSLDRPVVALCPGAEFGASKQWPAEYYAVLAQACIERGQTVWILGSARDKAIAARIQSVLADALLPFCRNLCGLTTLEQVMDLLQFPAQVISNDSGLMHVAAAVVPERPLWVIYGSTSPDFTPPLASGARILRHDISCSPCFERECPLGHHDCMRKLRVDTVLEQMRQEGLL